MLHGPHNTRGPVASGAMETREDPREAERGQCEGPGGFGERGWRPWVLGVQDRRRRSGASAGQPAGRGGCEGKGGLGGDLREKQGLLA